MLLHVAFSNFREHVQSPVSSLWFVFVRHVLPVDNVTRRLRFYTKSSTRSPVPSPVTLRQEYCHTDSSGEFLVNPVLTRRRWVPKSTSRVGQSHTGVDYVPYRPGTRTSIVTSSAPSTKWELLQHLRQMLSLTPAAPFFRLLSIHGHYRSLQSVESYNLLLFFSIRHSFSSRTRFLLDSMAANHVEPNEVTEKLVMRYLVSRGYWKTAWQQVVTRYSSVDNIPLPVLLELLAPGTRNFPRPNHMRESSRQSPPGHQAALLDWGSTVKIPLDTLVLILQRFPTLSLDELARLPPRVVSYVVRGLIRNGHEESAILITKRHLMSLPSNLSLSQVAFARDLVHLHLTTGAIKLANFKRRRRLVETLFSIHPSLQPNALTVFLLLRYLGRSQRCGIEAYLFFNDYRKRWGSMVDSLDSRRRIIQYALKQRKLGIAKDIYALPPIPMEQPPNRVYVPFRMRPWRSIYPRRGREKRHWKRVLYRYLGRRRARKRQLSIPRHKQS